MIDIENSFVQLLAQGLPAGAIINPYDDVDFDRSVPSEIDDPPYLELFIISDSNKSNRFIYGEYMIIQVDFYRKDRRNRLLSQQINTLKEKLNLKRSKIAFHTRYNYDDKNNPIPQGVMIIILMGIKRIFSYHNIDLIRRTLTFEIHYSN